MNAREEILTRIRTAVADLSDQPPAPRAYAQTTNLPDHAAAVDLFVERVRDYKAQVDQVAPTDLLARITEVVAGWGSGSVVCAPDLDDEWRTAIAAAAPLRRDDPPLELTELDGCLGVVTSAAVGIAVTGTIVLDAGPGMGRRALSLVPDKHLCVIRADQVVGGVPEAIAALDPRRPTTFISGPSATSDIELKRVEGVHGPRTLHVIVVD